MDLSQLIASSPESTKAGPFSFQNSFSSLHLLISQGIPSIKAVEENLGCDNSSFSFSLLMVEDDDRSPELKAFKAESEDITDPFPEKLYAGIEEFLDKEDLHIICPKSYNTNKSNTKLKACPNLQRLNSSSINLMTSTQDSDSSFSEKDFTNVAMPSFLLRRTISASNSDKTFVSGLSELLAGRSTRPSLTSPPSLPMTLIDTKKEE